MKRLLTAATLLLAGLVYADTNTNIVIRVSKPQYHLQERVMIEVIQLHSAVQQQDQLLFANLMSGGGTIVVMSGTTTVHRAEMFPIQAPVKDPDGLKFFHFVGISGRSPIPALAPGRYMVYVEIGSWTSNQQVFEVEKGR